MIASRNVLVVDVDGTLCAERREGESYAEVAPEPRLIARLRELHSAGWRIIVHSARGMRSRGGNIAAINREVLPEMLAWLDRHGVPYDEILLGKPWAGHDGFYIDDRALRPREFLDNDIDTLHAMIARDRLTEVGGMNGTVAITMAGLGSRFTLAGYDRPKYEIDALGRPLFDWSMLSLRAFRDAGWRFSFAVRAGVGAEDFVRGRCAALGIAVTHVLTLEHVTDGQATTALALAQAAPAGMPFAIYNIDTFVAPGRMIPPDPSTCAGWIPCFAAPGDGWSFARLDADGAVVELREKVRISDHATLGLYWFDSAARFVAAYAAYFAAPGREEKGERYVAPLYNQLIAEGARVLIDTVPIDDVGMLGIPEQVAHFIAEPPRAALAEAARPHLDQSGPESRRGA